tara:strand:+ start:252 stop:794 length:543 start_codon:yes stop_codon:yes gene_type:complete
VKYITALLLFIFLSNCNNTKTVLICGDHVCVNKDEAEQYFEENLTLEVKVINKKEKKEIDLIELNLKENKNDIKKITLFTKKNTEKNLKILNNDEISKIKKNVKNNKRSKKIKKEKTKKKDTNNKIVKRNTNKKLKINNEQVKKKVVDICSILEECNIDEISKYLLKQGKKKFPDITKRQ